MAVEALNAWRRNPALFFRDVLKLNPYDWQEDVLHAITRPNAHVSVRSGHGVGKSALAAGLILWHQMTHAPAKVPCTAPTMHQLRDILWSELGVWYKRMPPQFQGLFRLQNSDQNMRFTTLDSSDSSFAVARTGSKDNPEALQGFHSDNLLFVIDESSGVADVVFEVAHGALSGPNARVLMLSNPTRPSGFFFDSHHTNRAAWDCFKVDCRHVPSVSRQYIDEMARTYGEDSNVYRVRVLGDFPLEQDDTIVPLHLVEAAINRRITSAGYRPVWGLDVARGGSDRNALAIRKGDVVDSKVEWWHSPDLMATVGRVARKYRDAQALEKNGIPRQVPSEILVDVIQMGAGVVDRLVEIGLPARGINVWENPASADSRFSHQRDELWWMAREWFEDRDCQMIEDPELIAELTSVQYTHTSSGKLKILDKQANLKRSPDLADAFVLTFGGRCELPEAEMDYERPRAKRTWRSI